MRFPYMSTTGAEPPSGVAAKRRTGRYGTARLLASSLSLFASRPHLGHDGGGLPQTICASIKGVKGTPTRPDLALLCPWAMH
jgi:hypothetical protein